MKKLILILVSLVSLSVAAAEIRGTLMLKGSLKTKITLKTIPTTCKLKVDKVKNLLEEDSFGNPAYQAKIQISLDGSDIERNIKVKLDKTLTVINLHVEGQKSQVKDFDYFNTAENVKVTIDSEGRLVSTSFPYESQIVTCKF